MSKRFGRNQRRKMRAEIAELMESRERITMRFVDERRRNNELSAQLSSWAQDVVDLIGRDSAFNLQAQSIAVQDVGVFGDSINLDQGVRLARMGGVVKPGDVPTLIPARQVIRALIWRLRLSTDGLGTQVRIQLENEHREPVAYVLGVDQRWTERDIRYIANDIARKLIAFLNKEKYRVE